ncbi:hypothetical protein PHAMO_210229 [Magnetospirillum molischianum DSM 120]|uniref:J domain-containing protein n=1 Tax=Magnetospirillum molischianum DSM 120 TaxID=1150626 RepID=H8FQT0_MAGML|nr:hypothetical protein PHAMO_210229 [Magnetospirillum molischianum DSM 120]
MGCRPASRLCTSWASPPGLNPDRRMVKAKFRMLATIHHPDSSHGNHLRMSQLNAAIDLLRNG